MIRFVLVGVGFIALAIPGLANAGTTHGVVVAKLATRHVLVVADARGAVTTARVTGMQLSKVKVGSRLALAGTSLADGSLRISRLNRLGSAKRTRLRVVVIRPEARKLLVTGGGSSFVIKLTTATRVLADAGTELQPGEQLETEVELDDGLVGTDVEQVGQAALIEFAGTVTGVDPASLTIASDGISSAIQLPTGVVLPAVVAVGAHVEVVASISGTTLTLVTIKVEDEQATAAGHGTQVDGDGSARVEGTVAAVGAGTITIKPGEGAAPVTFAIPSGLTLPTLRIGTSVEARGEIVNSVLTLTRLEISGSDGDGDASTGTTASSASSGDDGGVTGPGDDGGSGRDGGLPGSGSDD